MHKVVPTIFSNEYSMLQFKNLDLRVRAHVFLCILALLLKRIFEIECLKSKAVMLPLETVAKSKLVKYRLKFSEKENRCQVFPKVTNSTEEQKRIFGLAGTKTRWDWRITHGEDR